MSALNSRFSIAPDTAVQKFLVDMRLAADRLFRGWKQTLDDGFSKTSVSPAERRELVKPHPLEDYFYAGLIGLQATALREGFSPTVAEALLRQVALQVDAAVGRSDRIISNLVFIIFGRIRKNKDLGLNVPAHEVVTDVILERLAIDRLAATRHLMRDCVYRKALAAPLTDRVIWWDAFRELYVVKVTPQPLPRRSRLAAREMLMAGRAPAVAPFEAPPRPSPEPPSLAVKLGQWLTPRPHAH